MSFLGRADILLRGALVLFDPPSGLVVSPSNQIGPIVPLSFIFFRPALNCIGAVLVFPVL